MRVVTTDVVVIGSGAAGLLATATARQRGLQAIVVESTDKIGGSSAMSHGTLWLPGNPLMADLGESDSPDAARIYLDACAGEERPASTRARRDAFLETAATLAGHLETLGMRLEAATGLPDSFPDRPGGKTQGRTAECRISDADVLGEWRERCRFTGSVAFKSSEVPRVATSLTTGRGLRTAANVLAGRSALGRLRGKHYVSGGSALVTGLLASVLRSGAGIWTDVEMRHVVVDDGRVAGVVVGRGDNEIQINARRGVVMSSGGFEHNQNLRERYLPQPTDERWSSGNPGNLGRALDVALEVGAATDLVDDAWWAPTFIDERREARLAHCERALPHSIIVDGDGNRYFNEAEPPTEVGHHIYARQESGHGDAVPSWLIMDNRHRRRYPLGRWMPGITPRAALRSGAIVKAGSISELAHACGIDEAGLLGTIARFNGLAARGKDEDFSRGESSYDRSYGDPHHQPNPCLGTIAKGPFWAVPIVPGDLGTKGGLVTDENARVLRRDGSVIGGLYAAGGSSASVMAGSDPGAGAALAAACVFAHRAVEDIAARA